MTNRWTRGLASIGLASIVLVSSNRAEAQSQACEALSHLASVGTEGTTWTSTLACDVSLEHESIRFAYPLPRGARLVSSGASLVSTAGAPTGLRFDAGALQITTRVVLFTPAVTNGPALTPPLLEQEAPQLVALDDDERIFTADAVQEPERGRRAVVFVGAPHALPSSRALGRFRALGARGEVLVVRVTPDVRASRGLRGVLETRSSHFRKTYVALALITVLGCFLLARVYRRFASDVELEEAEAIIRGELEP